MELLANTEQLGLFVEKFCCSYYGIPFRTKRKEQAVRHPSIRNDVHRVLQQLPYRIKEHLGHLNEKYDFTLEDKRTLSVKTCFKSSKVCPQTIGQTTLYKLSEHFGTLFYDNKDFKSFVCSKPRMVLETYLRYLFCCSETLCFMFHQGMAYRIQKTSPPQLVCGNITMSQDSSSWRESTTFYLNQQSIAECQVHRHRNCIKLRFNLEKLIQNHMIQGIHVVSFSLVQKYKFGLRSTFYNLSQCQCLALTQKGLRCKRGGDRAGFCFQHIGGARC